MAEPRKDHKEHVIKHEVPKQEVVKSAAKPMSSAFVWQMASIVLVIVLAGSVLTHGFTFSSSPSGLTIDQAKNRAVNYISALLEGQTEVTASAINESNGLYAIKLNVAGQEFDSYMTKDGSLLFPSAYAIPANISVTAQAASNGGTNTTAVITYPKSNSPNVKFFVMAFCPYGQQAETGLKGAFDALGTTVDWEPHFVIYSNYGSADYCLDANQTYCSMHGRAELNEDVRQLCIWKNYNASTWWNYVSAINSQCSVSNVETCWLGVANSTGINTTKIATCQATEAVSLLSVEKQLNDALGVRGSPTIYINAQDYSGARSAEGFKSTICSAFTTAPAGCDQTLSATATAANGGCGT